MAREVDATIKVQRAFRRFLAKRRAASMFPGMAIMYFFHFKRQWHKAVVFAPVGPLMQAITDPLFQIHILGRKAEGPLSRPFKSQQQRMMEEMADTKKTLEEDDDEDDEDGDGVEVEVLDDPADVCELTVEDDDDDNDDDDDDDSDVADDEGSMDD